MSRLTSRRRSLRSERGGVLVMVSVSLAALLAFVVFVVDLGNWFEHKRHLQVQADAAALAGGANLGVGGGCSNATVEQATYDYGGPEAAHPTSPYNRQVGGTPTNALHLLINSQKFWNSSGTNYSDGGEPCGATTPCKATNPAGPHVDVKVTEAANSALSFFSGILPTINARACVQLVAQLTTAGALPIAVPNPRPKSGGILFIDEANGNAVIKTAPLTENPSVAGQWSTAATPVAIPSARSGVVVALSGATTISLTGGLAAVCTQQLVTCYDSTSTTPANGVDFIRGWSNSATYAPGGPPLLRDVELFASGGCNDAWFTTSGNGSCTVGIEARVDSGSITSPGLKIFVNGGNCPSSGSNPGCALAPDAGCTGFAVQGTGACWKSTAIPVPTGNGAVPLTMKWKQTTGTVNGSDCTRGNGCSDDFQAGTAVQRIFGATQAKSGPIQALTLYDCDGDPSCLTSGIQSFQTGTSHSLAVTLQIAGGLQNAKTTNDPLVSLRVVNGNGPSTQSLDCTPGSNTAEYPVGPTYTTLWQELAFGCGPSYTINDGSIPCPTPSTLWNSTPQPWACVATQTGQAPNQVAEGLNTRVICVPHPSYAGCNTAKPSQCPPPGDLGHNNWSMFVAGAPNDGFPEGDPRILQAFLTPYGTFANLSGTSKTIPITDFAVFYVTGWTGQGAGFNNPCQGNGDDLVPGGDPGVIVGHFIKYVNQLNSGSSNVACDPNSLGACVAVLEE